MSEHMQEAEKQGQVNRLQISGHLLSDLSDTQTSTGKRVLKTRLRVDGKEPLYMDITVWANERSQEELTTFLQWKSGMSVVVTGKLTMRTWNGRVYLGIDASSIE